jgi:serine protease
VDHARSRGAIVVAAAGNSGGSVGFPGACEGVVGVSATDADDKLAKFSSRGPEVDLAAPGVNVVQQTVCQGGKNKCEQYPGYSGTSMATPHVAGAAALLVSLGVTDPDAIERRLEQSARVVDDSASGKKLYGAGILDAAAAVRKVTLEHGLVRLGLLLGLSIVAGITARRKSAKALSPSSPAFALGGLLAGPGLLFFAPLFASRVLLPVDLLARPLADMDLYVGASLHRLLPLATAILPALMMVMFHHVKSLRLLTAGIATGTAAYLGSVVFFGESFGGVGMMAWCALNALASFGIARLCLAPER